MHIRDDFLAAASDLSDFVLERVMNFVRGDW